MPTDNQPLSESISVKFSDEFTRELNRCIYAFIHKYMASCRYVESESFFVIFAFMYNVLYNPYNL